MTPELRAQVAELLRETADKYDGIAEAYSKLYGVDVTPRAHALNCLDKTWREQHPIWDNAVLAREAVNACWQDWSTEGYPSYESTCLQAADLIEEGKWP